MTRTSRLKECRSLQTLLKDYVCKK
jgi:hypothetical protein